MSYSHLRSKLLGSPGQPGWLSLPFAPSITLLAAIGLLMVATQTILRIRSFKYLAALLVAATVGVLFLVVQKRVEMLIFLAGLNMPFFVQATLLQRDFYGFGVTGTFAIALALGGVLFLFGQNRDQALLLEPGISVPAILFLLTALLSIVNTSDRTLTFIGLAQEAEMLLIFLILVNAIREKEHFLIFLRGLYLGFAVETVIYVIQNVLGFSFDIVGNTRSVGGTSVKHNFIGSQRGTFATAPAAAALYFLVLTLGLLGNYLCRKRLPIRLNALLGGAMGVGCLILAAKRAPLLGFALALVCFSALLYFYSPGGLKRLAPILLALAIPAVSLLPILLIRARDNYSAALDERVNLMRVAQNMYEEYPLLGAGFGTYADVKKRYLPGDWEGWLSLVHNRYLLIRAETGTLGILALVFLYGMMLRAAWRGILRIDPCYRPYQIALVAGLIAIFWEMAWDIFHSRQQSYILWYTVALAVMAPRVLKKNQGECPT